MITISEMNSDHLAQVSLLKVVEEQEKFVGTMDEILSDVNDEVHPHVILHQDKVVGFFLIDTYYQYGYDFCLQDGLGLRAFFIDATEQAKGYGTRAVEALSGHLSLNYPRFKSVYLTVNCKNPAAYSCYQKAGFMDTGKLYHGGAAGPQHIMQMHF
ncbi:GNAT family N-acetyltransferase [Vibrio sp. LaRot3]|uniref:GNAT family N-acetyltransferase n=1 Tax=Vibrio sp. LaRot3 TaxID=2998829 RepID=UPI0022CE1492|nr:GNAT family N-acetyltransferase [Vibrio sp. LaRot3]MDA0149578.1 GNAT family N-acetyltransferase [Vibrio sp. LaRot3]